MTTPMPAVLVVDDDPFLLATVRRVLQHRFDLTLESDPLRALDILQSGKEFAAIVSDLRMPGMNGLALLQDAGRICPCTPRVLISGAPLLTDTVSAINDCQVFRVLVKPFQGAALIGAVTAATKQYHATVAERKLLQETVKGSVQALAELFLLVQPAAFGRAMRLRRHVADLARYLGVQDVWEMEIAALFSQIGTVALSNRTLDRWYRGRDLSMEERAEVARVSSTAQSLIANIPRLEKVNEILRMHDVPASRGSVPLGARLLAIAIDFDVLIAQGETAEAALSILEHRSGRYDPRLLAAFRALRGDAAPAGEIREMRLMDIGESMVLASDVYSATGLLLIARGQRVTTALLDRIRTQWTELAARTTVRVVTSPSQTL
jgi:response regulator RpfG family c-di-GMP phosphodiesterase